MQQVWRERDETEIDVLRERVQRLRIMEENKRVTAQHLHQAGMNRDAEVQEAEAEGLRQRRRELLRNIVRVEKRKQQVDVAVGSRGYPHD